MSEQEHGRRGASTGLAVLGLLILVGAIGYVGYRRYQGGAQQARLPESPVPMATPSEHVPTVPATGTAASPVVATAANAPVSLATALPVATQPSPAIAAASGAGTATGDFPAVATVAAVTETRVPVPSVLGTPSGPPVRIVIPDLGIDVGVVEMGWRAVETADGLESQWIIPEDAAGHHINSARLGESGNIVISGHNNVYGRVFEPISQAWDNATRVRVDAVTDRSDVLEGRPVQLFDEAGQRFDYTIREFLRLRDTGASAEQRIANARFMQPTDDARLTLVTCWPPWNNTHRLVVVAVPAGRP